MGSQSREGTLCVGWGNGDPGPGGDADAGPGGRGKCTCGCEAVPVGVYPPPGQDAGQAALRAARQLCAGLEKCRLLPLGCACWQRQEGGRGLAGGSRLSGRGSRGRWVRGDGVTTVGGGERTVRSSRMGSRASGLFVTHHLWQFQS